MKATAIGQQFPFKAIAPSRLAIASGTIELLKWLALVLMTLDHVNKYFFAEKLPGLFELGRLAMPLFGFVFAYNLARPGALETAALLRTAKRLSVAGLAASPFFMALGGLAYGWWPLNIMFMLLVAAVTLHLVEKGGNARLAAVAVFLIGGAFVEFWWFGLAFCLCAWWYCKYPNKKALVAWFIATALLYVVNRNLWAFAAIPVILAAPMLKVEAPRFKHLFYVYYPAHLALLLAASYLLGDHL